MAQPPGRQIVRHQIPGTARSVDVEDAVENVAIGILARSSVAFVGTIHLRKEGLQERPLGVGQVGRIGLSVLHRGFYAIPEALILNPLTLLQCNRAI